MKTVTFEPPEVLSISKLELSHLSPGKLHRFWLKVVTDGIGQPIQIPVIVAKGRHDGPTLGLTAALHGNEINGIPVIQRLIREIDLENFSGDIVGLLVLNVPSLLRKKRRFVDGVDLNHIMPGKPDGNVSEVYSYRIVQHVITKFDYLVDLHTASFGRVNSYYIRADMSDKKTARMAVLQNAQIIVDNPPSDGTLRGAAEALGIPAITLEVGDPNSFQKGMIRSSMTGLHNLLCDLNMVDGIVETKEHKPVFCHTSYWLYAETGGILQVYPNVGDRVSKGDKIATQKNVFGDVISEYAAPEDGIVIGKSINPICQTGGRILHLGVQIDELQVIEESPEIISE